MLTYVRKAKPMSRSGDHEIPTCWYRFYRDRISYSVVFGIGELIAFGRCMLSATIKPNMVGLLPTHNVSYTRLDCS